MFIRRTPHKLCICMQALGSIVNVKFKFGAYEYQQSVEYAIHMQTIDEVAVCSPRSKI